VAYRSGDGLAADIHMRLSALHLSQALLLQAARRGQVCNVLPFQKTGAAAQFALAPMPIAEAAAVGHRLAVDLHKVAERDGGRD
jgi:hypothetical protein